jgi:hypothetical protein
MLSFKCPGNMKEHSGDHNQASDPVWHKPIEVNAEYRQQSCGEQHKETDRGGPVKQSVSQSMPNYAVRIIHQLNPRMTFRRMIAKGLFSARPRKENE